MSKAQRPCNPVKAALPPSHDHPAVFSQELIEPLADTIRGRDCVIDPFAGTGRIHSIAQEAGVPRSIGIELEKEWANASVFNGPDRLQIVGDALSVLPKLVAGTIDAVLTSPAYGNRMADNHSAKDVCKTCAGTGVLSQRPCSTCKGRGLSRRNTYRHRLGRALSKNNGGGMQWGEEYRSLHRAVWEAASNALSPGGVFVVNCSNHIRRGEEVDVCTFHKETLEDLGLTLEDTIKVETRRNRQGANGHLRVPEELIMVCSKPLKQHPRNTQKGTHALPRVLA